MSRAIDQDAAFLRAILAHPDDATPRLVYADWLEEHGGAQHATMAEFIRVQCESARLYAYVSAWSSSPGRAEDGGKAGESLALAQNLDRRAAELFDTLGANPFGACFDGGLCTVTIDPVKFHAALRDDEQPPCLLVRRGFVEAAAMPLALWVRHGTATVQRTPLRVACLRSEPMSTEDRIRGLASLLRALACDDEPGDNPVCRLDTLDLSRLSVNYYMLNHAMNEAYRPWRGLRRLVLPNWSDLQEQYRPHYVGQWKERVPTLKAVDFDGARFDWREHA